MPSIMESPSRSSSLKELQRSMSNVLRKARSNSLVGAEKQKQKIKDGLQLLKSLSSRSKQKLLKATSTGSTKSLSSKEESFTKDNSFISPRPTNSYKRSSSRAPSAADDLYGEESTTVAREVPAQVVSAEVVASEAEKRQVQQQASQDLSGRTNQSTIPAGSSSVETDSVPTGTLNGNHTANDLRRWDSIVESSWGPEKVLRWSFILGLIAVAVSFYCGDVIKNPHQASTTFKGMLPPFRTVSGWRSMQMLWPVESPALERGSVLRSGDFIYSCRPAAIKGQACQPTVFHLHDDGRLTLSVGTSPNNVKEELWSSKKIAPYGAGDVTAVYEEDGSLSVRQGDKAFFSKGKYFVSSSLKPWPLSL